MTHDAVGSICVFCGSSPGSRPAYVAAARELGRELAERNLGLVYGGGQVGLMGAIARQVLELKGHVTGVIPRALTEREIALEEASTLHVVASMHERKALMSELSEAFIALPGGFGTLEEFFEAVTWAQLGIHSKPIGLLDVAGFYEPLVRFLHSAVDEGFLRPEYLQMVVYDDDPGSLLDRFEEWSPPPPVAWLDLKES